MSRAAVPAPVPPLRVGPLTLANRVVFSAHLTNYAEDGLPTEQHAEYYAARAAGGAGLIITEEHSTHPTDWPYEKLIHGFRPEVIPGYRRITAAVHAHGVPILAQLNHNGGQASGMYSRLPGVGAEPGAGPAVPRGAQGRRARTRSPRSWPATPASPGTARRAGSTASSCSARIPPSCAGSCPRRPTSAPTATAARWRNRARLLLEIVAAVREAIGPGRALGVRICGDELIEGGTTLDEAVEVARMVEAHRPGRLHQHLDRRGHRHAVHDRGEHAGPARVRACSSRPRSAQAVRPAGDRGGPDQGPAAGRPGAGRRAVRPGRRGPRPDRRPGFRGQGPGRARRRRSAPACPATRNASAGWA